MKSMNFREYNQDQGRFLQINLSKAIEDNHPSRIVNEIVELLDLTSLYSRYKNEGNPPYHPKMMLKVLFYGYMIGIYSCRKIRDQLNDFNFPFLYLSAGDVPSFCTINNFRLRHIEELPYLFTQIVLLCVEVGMVDFGFLAIDGQKIKANASFKQSKTRRGITEEIARIEKKLETLLGKEPSDDDERPAKNSKEKLENRKNKLKNALSKLEDMISNEEDKKKHDKMRINITDNDAPVMTHKDSTKKPSYETYAAVDHKNQIIMAYDSTSSSKETEQAIPLIVQSYYNGDNTHHEAVALDSGFSSFENLDLMEDCPFELLMPDRLFDKWRKDGTDMEYDKSKFIYDEESGSMTCPDGKPMKPGSIIEKDNVTRQVFRGTSCEVCARKEICTAGAVRTVTLDSRDGLQNAMREKLINSPGSDEYRKRMFTVEPVFGNMQKNSRWTQFHLRGEEKAKGEFCLHAIAHNLKKVTAYLKEHSADMTEAFKSISVKYDALFAMDMR